MRARIGRAIFFVAGMAIWNYGCSFQIWGNKKLVKGLKQDFDFDTPGIFVGPIFVYIFYGMYDAL
jgi:hypothetical protein